MITISFIFIVLNHAFCYIILTKVSLRWRKMDVKNKHICNPTKNKMIHWLLVILMALFIVLVHWLYDAASTMTRHSTQRHCFDTEQSQSLEEFTCEIQQTHAGKARCEVWDCARFEIVLGLRLSFSQCACFKIEGPNCCCLKMIPVWELFPWRPGFDSQ